MYAISTNNPNVFRVGTSWLSAAADKAQWIVKAGGKTFEVTQTVTGDDACNTVKNILLSEGIKFSAIQFQRTAYSRTNF